MPQGLLHQGTLRQIISEGPLEFTNHIGERISSQLEQDYKELSAASCNAKKWRQNRPPVARHRRGQDNQACKWFQQLCSRL